MSTTKSNAVDEKKSKKRKIDELEDAIAAEKKYFVQLINGDDKAQAGPTIELDAEFTNKQLNELLNAILNNTTPMPYSFYLEGDEIANNVRETLLQSDTKNKAVSTQDAPLKITFFPQALFIVRPVTRCSATMPGHSEAILSVAFSPNGTQLASASGDATVRLWDLNTETPQKTLQGHQHWVLTVAWSPDAQKIASGGKDNIVKVWWAESGKKCCKPLKAHKKWITALDWEPFHLNTKANRLASASKDETIKIWNVVMGQCEFTLSGHTKGVTSIKWGGDGHIYSAAQDCTIRVWNVDQKMCVKILSGHAHWINTMAMSTDYILRRGAFDHNCEPMQTVEQAQEKALQRYKDASLKQPLRIITGSDDFTLCIWEPSNSLKPIARLTGHKGIVNHVAFSPDGRLIASASFDKTIKLWESATGKFITTLRGHVGAVYQISWSGDSRLLVSCSKDATAKVWDIQTKKLLFDLPGHFDEVFAVDWSPDGQRVASGGKDRVVKIWRH